MKRILLAFILSITPIVASSMDLIVFTGGDLKSEVFSRIVLNKSNVIYSTVAGANGSIAINEMIKATKLHPNRLAVVISGDDTMRHLGSEAKEIALLANTKLALFVAANSTITSIDSFKKMPNPTIGVVGTEDGNGYRHAKNLNIPNVVIVGFKTGALMSTNVAGGHILGGIGVEGPTRRNEYFRVIHSIPTPVPIIAAVSIDANKSMINEFLSLLASELEKPEIKSKLESLDFNISFSIRK